MAPVPGLARPVRAVAMALGTMILGALLALAPTGFAMADPSVAELEAQIDQAWGQLEPIIEQYNTVHSQLQANKNKIAALQQQIQPLELQVDLALSRVSQISVYNYKSGKVSMLRAILVSGSPSMLLDQLMLLNQMSRAQLAQISGVKEIRDKYLRDKQTLDELTAQLAAQDADLLAKKKVIETQINSLQKLRLQAYGTTTGTGVLRPATCPYEYGPNPGGAAAKSACAQIGKPYVWAAAGPSSFDCSGLTMYVWKPYKTLTHSAATQYKSETTHVSRTNLRPGDLVFYGSDLHHVAIYVGGGWMVHAPHTGDVVRMAKIESPGSIYGYGRPA